MRGRTLSRVGAGALAVAAVAWLLLDGGDTASQKGAEGESRLVDNDSGPPARPARREPGGESVPARETLGERLDGESARTTTGRPRVVSALGFPIAAAWIRTADGDEGPQARHRSYGQTPGGGWAIALEEPLFARGGWEFELQFRRGTRLLVAIEAARPGTIIEVPQNDFSLQPGPLVPIEFHLDGGAPEELERVETIQLKALSPAAGRPRISYAWGQIYVDWELSENVVRRSEEGFRHRLPAGRRFLAYVLEDELGLYGGSLFTHDGSRQVVALRPCPMFEGELLVPPGSSPPDAVLLRFTHHGQGIGWLPSPTDVRVALDGTFAFRGRPEHAVLGPRPLQREITTVLESAEYFPCSVTSTVSNESIVHLGEFVLEGWKPLACLEFPTGADAEDFAEADVSAYWEAKRARRLPLSKITEPRDGYVDVYSRERDGPPPTSTRALVVYSPAFPHGAVFHRDEEQGCFRLMESREYVASLSFPPLGEDEELGVYWRWRGGLIPDEKEMIVRPEGIRLASDSYSRVASDQLAYELRFQAPAEGVELVVRSNAGGPSAEKVYPLSERRASIDYTK